MGIYKRIILLLCAALLLAACSQNSGERQVHSAQQTASPLPTVTNTPTPTETSPPTRTPTPTPTPSPFPEPTVTPSPTPEPTDTATPTPMPIVEGALGRGQAEERLAFVMIDNHPNAYPQTGLDKAVIVIEALAEYGLTRYNAVLAPGISPDVEEIGPVRSARDYFVQWAMGFQAIFVHAGGSPSGLALAESATEIANMDALRRDTEIYFYRHEEEPAPHNLYTSTELIREFVEDKDASDFDPAEQGFLFKPEAEESQRPDSQRLDYYFIYSDDPAGWEYDPATNGYWRLRRGEPHIDARSGEQLWFKNVIVMEAEQEPIPGDDKGRIQQKVIGTGRARLFADGMEREVRWRKPDAAMPLRFYNTRNEEVAMNAGPIWIAVVPTLDNLSVE